MTRATPIALSALLVLGAPLTAVPQDESAAPAPPAEAAAEPEPELFVLSGRSVDGLADVHRGLTQYLRETLERTGVDTRDGRSARMASSPGGHETQELLAIAADAGASAALLVDLRAEEAALHVGLRLYETETRTLIGIARATSTDGVLARAATAAARDLMPRLGLEDARVPKAAPLGLEELAASGRALTEIDRGELARAWRELAGQRSPAASRLRLTIEAQAEAPEAPRAERARLLVVRGEMDSAWELIEEDVEAARDLTHPDPRLLLAAGEIQLELGALDEAGSYFERLQQLQPKNRDAVIGLGRAHALAGELEQARADFERAARLEPESPRALELHAKLATRDADERARLLLAAGDRAAAQLSSERAMENYGRAMRLDPMSAAETRERAGRLHARLMDHERALESFSDAVELGGPDVARLENLAREQRLLGELPAAQLTYARALELEQDNVRVMRNLAEVHTEAGAAQEAVVLLDRAADLEPTNSGVLRSLARAHHALGSDAQALRLHDAADELGEPTLRSLTEAASIARTLGDFDSASARLERAVELEPTLPDLRADLAAVYRESGDESSAQLAERLIVEASPEQDSAAEPELAPTPVARDPGVASFDELLASFDPLQPEADPVRLLGVAEQRSGLELVRAWLDPMAADVGRIEKLLHSAVKARYPMTQKLGGAVPSNLRQSVSALMDFSQRASLDSLRVSQVNRELGTSAVFAANLTRGDAVETVCGPGVYQIELRMLAGQLSGEVVALGNKICMPPGLEGSKTWNRRAAAVYALLMLLIAFPFVRGWGTIVVMFKFPKKTKPLFAVRVSRKPYRKVNVEETGDKTRNRWKIEEQLMQISLFEKRLEGDRVVFSWVAARRKPYYVTVRGPMVDATTGDSVGAFQEERTVKVVRGREVKLDFDLRLKECAIEVGVHMNEELAERASIAFRGQPGSARFSRGKKAFLYAGVGRHVIVAAAGDRLAEKEIRIHSIEPVRIDFDLANPRDLLFSGSPEAVTAYLEGNFDEACDHLERAGQEQTAHRLRARLLLESGDSEAASHHLEAAGDLKQAAELRSGTDEGASAELFEQAGEYPRAALAYHEVGDIANAARMYEAAHDWRKSIECYRELGDIESVMRLLEFDGEYLEVGQIAEELNQAERALENYRQIGAGDPRYGEACCRMGTILQDKEELDLAVEKFQEAAEYLGSDLMPIAIHYRLACLLEELEHVEDALATFEAIRRRDSDYSDVKERTEELRKQIAEEEQLRAQGTVAIGDSAAVTQPSRYEILGELGRGGMGVVFRARDTNLGRIVALKRLPENLKDHPTAVKLFLREARSAASLNHPNVVTVFDAGQEQGVYFITMECLEGTGFDGLLKAYGTLGTRDVALLGLQSATGLAYAHANGIIHRDIKSSNLFYTTERVVKIMDFGLAKAVEEVRRNASMIAGTPYFMAPEQSAGGVIDHRADLYSLGVTLYQMVTGKVPFHDGDVTYHHRHTPPPDPREHVPDLPAELAELLLKLLAKKPDHRVQTADELVERLRQIAEAS